MKLNLYQRELIAIDGSKFRASNNKDNCYNQEVLEKKIANIEKNIQEYLRCIDEADKKVLIRMKHSSEMTTQRMSLSEHPFGTVK